MLVFWGTTVDGRHPAITSGGKGRTYPIIYKVLAYIPGGWPWDFFPSQAKVFEAECTRLMFADNYMFDMLFP